MSNTKRALVVDDDEATVALFRKILIADHWEVDAFTSGYEAVASIQPGRFGLVISDIHMPEMTGVELYDRALKADPDLRSKFIFISGYTDNSAVKRFLLESRCPGIRKPIRLDEFRAVVAHVGESKPLVAAGLASRWFTPDCQYLYSGEITGRHTLFSLLHRIYAARLTGLLMLQLGRVEKKLYFNLGNLIFASSNLPGDGLGEVLLREGAMTQSHFDEAALRVERGQRFGDALVDLGVCAPAQLTNWVRLQVTQIATSIFEYPTGRYYFFDSFGEDNVPEVGIALPMGQYLQSALREADDLPLGELAGDEGLTVDVSPDPLLRFQDVQLNDSERRLLASIMWPMRAGDAIRAAGLSGSDGARALYALLALGMVMAVAPGAEEKAPPRPQPEAARPTAAVPPRAAAPPTPAAAPPVAEAPRKDLSDPVEFEKEMQRLMHVAETGTHYQLLGVAPSSENSQIKKSFYTLARQFHPDRHMGRSEWIGSLQRVMDALTSAYKTLGDLKARAKYDKQLTESGAFSLGRGKSERQETAEECLEKAKECLRAKNFAGSITWLRKCVEIAPKESKYRAMLARSLAAVPTYRQEAVTHYEKATELDPFNASTYFQFAELFEEMQLPWRALALYKKILDIDPDHAKARERIRALEAAGGKKDDTNATFLGRILNRKPTSATP